MSRSWAVTNDAISLRVGTTNAVLHLAPREMRLMARQLLQAAEEADARAAPTPDRNAKFITPNPDGDWPHVADYWSVCRKCDRAFCGPKRAPTCWACQSDQSKADWEVIVARKAAEAGA